MKVLRVIPGRFASVELSTDELYLINNALNETLNGIDLEEFQTRVGASREVVGALLQDIHALTKSTNVGT